MGCGHHETAVLHSFEADEPIGQLLDLRRLTVHDEHFEAGIEVEMSMAGRNDQLMVCVLDFGELLSDSVGVVIVDQSHRSNHRCIRNRRLLADEPVPDQIAESLRTVRVTPLSNGTVEPLKKLGIERNADSAEVAQKCLRIPRVTRS